MSTPTSFLSTPSKEIGRPWLAFRVFLGWRTSWLSREAIAFGVYMTAASTTAMAFFVGWNSDAIGLAVLTTIIGVVAVASFAMIYIATRRSLWNAPRTAVEFAATTLGLGCACMAVFDLSATSAWIVGQCAAFESLALLCFDRDLSDARGKYMSRAKKRLGRLALPLLRQSTGPLTQQLLLDPNTFGLGSLPIDRVPAAMTVSVCGFCSTGCGRLFERWKSPEAVFQILKQFSRGQVDPDSRQPAYKDCAVRIDVTGFKSKEN